MQCDLDFLQKDGRLDDNTSIFFARELEFVKARSFDIKFPQFKFADLIPISTDAGAGAEQITYSQFTPTGFAKIIANYADDLPRADVFAKQFTIPVKTIGASYGYNIQEIQNAQMAGKPLVQRKANSTRRANDQKVNNLAWLGRQADTDGIQGFLFNPDVPSAVVQDGATTSNKLWSAKNPDEIVADLFKLIDDVFTLTLGVEVPNQIILPIAQWSLISSLRMEAGTDTTVMEFFMKNRPGVAIDFVNEFTAVDPLPTGATGPKDLMVGYVKDLDHLSLELPQPYTQEPVQRRNLEFVVNTHSRIGGVIFYYPLSANIVEGI